MQVHRNVRLLGWFNFLSDFRLYAPVAILYYTQVAGSFALGMSVFSIIMLASALFEVPTGVISDLVGRKRTVILGAVASITAMVFYAVGGTYAMLVIGAIFEGLARSFFSGNNDALLHDTLTQSGQHDGYQEYLGRTASMYQFALAISAVVGGVLASISFPLLLWLSVIPQVLSLFVSLGFVEPKVHEQRETNVFAHLRTALRNIVINPRLRNLSVGSTLGFGIGEASFEFRAAFIASLWPVWAIGLTRLISNVLAAVSFYYAGRWIKRFGELRLILAGHISSHIITFLLTVFPGVLSPALMSTFSIFFGVVSVSTNSLRQREFTPQQRATMGSLTSFGGSLAFAVFALLFGALADQIGVGWAFAISQLIGLIPVMFYWRAFHHPSVEAPVVAVETP